MNEMKPCPFCGGKNIFVDGYDHAAGKRWRAICLDCMATVDPGTMQQKYRAIEEWNRRAEPENKPLTNLEALFGTPEKIADVLLPMLPTMEGFCQYCKHWNDGECKVNPHWDCKNALVNWLKSKPEQEEK